MSSLRGEKSLDYAGLCLKLHKPASKCRAMRNSVMFGEWLRRRAALCGYRSIQAFARRCGMNRATISQATAAASPEGLHWRPETRAVVADVLGFSGWEELISSWHSPAEPCQDAPARWLQTDWPASVTSLASRLGVQPGEIVGDALSIYTEMARISALEKRPILAIARECIAAYQATRV